MWLPCTDDVGEVWPSAMARNSSSRDIACECMCVCMYMYLLVGICAACVCMCMWERCGHSLGRETCLQGIMLVHVYVFICMYVANAHMEKPELYIGQIFKWSIYDYVCICTCEDMWLPCIDDE
jgi:hypothetical protein